MLCPACRKNALSVHEHHFGVICPDCNYSDSFVDYLTRMYPEGNFKQLDTNGIMLFLPAENKSAVIRFDRFFKPMRIRIETADPHFFAQFVQGLRIMFGIFVGTVQIHLVGIMPILNTTCPLCGRNQIDLKQSTRRPEVLYCPCGEYFSRFEYLVASQIAAMGYKVEISKEKDIKCFKKVMLKRIWPLPDKEKFVRVLELECLFGRAEMLMVIVRSDPADIDFIKITGVIKEMLLPRIRMVGVEL